MLLHKRKYLVVIIFISLFQCVLAQYNHQLRASWHAGLILKHKGSVRHLVQGPIRGIELNYIRPTNGSKQWHTINNHPDLGAGFSYYYLNNEKELGELYALHAIFDLYLFNKQKSYLTFRLSPGLSYATKIFNEATNYRNNFLSTPINSFINLKWTYGYRMNQRLSAELAFGIAHNSNGAFQQPNLGVNILSTSLSLKYQLNKTTHKKDTLIIDSKKKQHIFQSHFALGKRVNNRILEQTVQCATLSLNYYKGINHSNAIGIGLDFYYRHSTKPYFSFSKLDFEERQATFYQLGLKMNYLYRAGRMDFPFEVGVYLVDKYKLNGAIFNRIGLRYHITDHFMTNITLKAHTSRADYIEWGVGYDF
jgi:Lipid A 3-O-deacylase (PagL)